MKRYAMAIGVLVLFGTLSGAVVARAGVAEMPDPSEEEAAVRAAVQYYLDGQAAGDGAIVSKAFHPEARMAGLREGELRIVPISEYVTWFRGEPAANEADRERWIESVDVVGDAALAKLVLDYPGVRFTDYMSLLKLDGEWKIIHKTYTAERK